MAEQEPAVDGIVFAGPWSLGFTRAMRLRWNPWSVPLDKTRLVCSAHAADLAYCADQIGSPLAPLLPGLDAIGYLKVAHHDIPLVVPSIRELWMPTRYAQATSIYRGDLASVAP